VTHRADQIVDAVAEIVRARVSGMGIKVFTHRRASLAADQDELPAISVDIGAEQAVTQNTGFIDSLLRMPITSVVVAEDEPTARAQLLDLRRQAHIGLMLDQTLGLSFVVSTTYGGVDDVETSVDGDVVVFSQTAPWLVYYRMNPQDPGD